MVMKANLLKGVGLFSALVVFGLVRIAGTRAQPAAGGSNSSMVTTNWIGCLVVGKGDPIDSIARGPFPTPLHQVQVGLRSDGVVVWRQAETK
jgi:hypothetical protein